MIRRLAPRAASASDLRGSTRENHDTPLQQEERFRFSLNFGSLAILPLREGPMGFASPSYGGFAFIGGDSSAIQLLSL